MKNKTLLYGANGKALIPNLDPGFFIPGPQGNITAAEIMDQPYKFHAWINACGRTISTNIARLPKVMVNIDDPTDIETSNELLDVFDNPNPFMKTSIVFWQAVILYLLLPSNSAKGEDNTGGQVFLLCLKDSGEKVNLSKGEIPDVIYPYSDNFIKPRHNEDGEFVGWLYEVNGGEHRKAIKIELDPNEIIRINFFNPYNWLKGLSYFSAAAIAFYQDVQSDIFNTTFFDNDATVSGLLTSDQHLVDEQYEAYMRRWYDNYGGVGKTNRTAILGAGLKYQQFGERHADMQFIEQKKWNRDTILAVHGLNKIAIGQYEDLNFATIKEGRKILWQDTYLPIDQIINKAINDQWVKNFGDKKRRLTSDKTDIASLREDFKERAEAGQAMVQGMDFPPVLAATINGIPLSEKNLVDYPWLSERPVKSSPATDGKDKDKNDKDDNKKYVIRNAKRIIIDKNEEEEERLKFSWDFINRILDPGEKQFIKIFERHFNSERNRMQDKVDLWLKTQEKLMRVLNISPNMFLLDTIQENKTLLKLMTPAVIAQMKRDKIKLEEELDGLIEWDVTDEKIEEFVNARKGEIKEINTTTFKKSHKKIGEAIAISVRDNETPGEAAKRIKAAIGEGMEIRKNQSKMIARTETGIISGKSRFGAFKVEGIDWHEWVTAQDDRVRDGTKQNPSWDHAAADKKVVKVGKLFLPVKLLYPLDTSSKSPGAKPGNIINCRCVAVAAEEPK